MMTFLARKANAWGWRTWRMRIGCAFGPKHEDGSEVRTDGCAKSGSVTSQALRLLSENAAASDAFPCVKFER